METSYKSLARLFACLTATLGLSYGVIWPIPPTDSVHPLCNNWGNYQNYMSLALFHNGIDVMPPGQQHAPVVSVSHGWVKACGTPGQPMHYRIAVSDSGLNHTGRAPGWMYAHLDESRPHKELDDEVSQGDTIGYLYPMGMGFDHVHFSRISDTGATWQRFPNTTWWFIENPIITVEPNTDTAAPVFEDSRPGQRFAFCQDNSSSYLDPTGLQGDIDIIARIHDKTGCSSGNPTWDRLAPYQIEYSIRSETGAVVIPWTVSVRFSNRLDAENVHVVYKNDATCRSRGTMQSREYFYIVTNTDGDTVIEAGDTQGRWATDQVPDGNYRVLVKALDICGNTTTDSMLVTTDNGIGIKELPGAALSRALEVSLNPTRGFAAIRFGLASAAMVRLRIVDQAGRITARLAKGRLSIGEYTFCQRNLAAGLYVVELTLNGTDNYKSKFVVIP